MKPETLNMIRNEVNVIRNYGHALDIADVVSIVEKALVKEGAPTFSNVKRRGW